MGLKGTRFATMGDIKWNATAERRKIPTEAFRRGFQQWQDDGASVCVCVCVRYRAIQQFRELFDCPSYNVSTIVETASLRI
jgi:hypothetical protein